MKRAACIVSSLGPPALVSDVVTDADGEWPTCGEHDPKALEAQGMGRDVAVYFVDAIGPQCAERRVRSVTREELLRLPFGHVLFTDDQKKLEWSKAWAPKDLRGHQLPAQFYPSVVHSDLWRDAARKAGYVVLLDGSGSEAPPQMDSFDRDAFIASTRFEVWRPKDGVTVYETRDAKARSVHLEHSRVPCMYLERSTSTNPYFVRPVAREPWVELWCDSPTHGREQLGYCPRSCFDVEEHDRGASERLSPVERHYVERALMLEERGLA